MAGISRVQRSMKKMRDEGYTCRVVEHWNPYAHIRQDLFGIIDILCIKKGEPVIGLQVTDMGGLPEHRRKAFDSSILPTWLGTGSRFVLHGWDKRSKRNKDNKILKMKTWQVKEEDITLNDVQ